jgi:CheY-like chemotaxis protein
MTDITFWAYALTSGVALVGFFVFTWWWRRNQRATTVYIYFTLLLGIEALVQGMHAYMRYLRMTGQDELMVAIRSSAFWPGRIILEFIIITCIVIHVIHRIHIQTMRKRLFEKRKVETPDTEFTEEIIIVDDHEEVVEMLSGHLKNAFPNITIYAAKTAEEGLELFKEHNEVNLLLTDLMLPNMNGFELCRTIKENCPWTIVIAMTGYGYIYEFWTAREAGFDDYFAKPFKIADFLEAIRREFETLRRWKRTRIYNADKAKGESNEARTC